MDFYSPFPGFVELIASPGEIIVDDNLFGEHPWLKLMTEMVFLYGSLPRPPDLQLIVCCMLFLTLLSTNVDFGTLSIVDHIAFWRYLASKYALSEGELRLESLTHIFQYVTDKGFLEMLLERCWLILFPTKLFKELHVIQKQKIPLYDLISQIMSSFPGSAEFIVPPAAFHVIDGKASWLRLKLELLLTYVSLPKPPELTTMCMICSSISRGIDFGTLTVDDFVMEWRTLEDKYVSTDDHFWLATIQQLIELTSCGCSYETHKILLQRHASSTSVPRQGELTVMILDWLSQRYQIMLIHLSPTKVYDGVQFLYKEEAKPVAITLYWKSKVAAALLTNTDLALLLHGDGSIVGQEHVDTSGSLNIFDFGSLTRPPEAHCVFSFKSLKFT